MSITPLCLRFFVFEFILKRLEHKDTKTQRKVKDGDDANPPQFSQFSSVISLSLWLIAKRLVPAAADCFD